MDEKMRGTRGTTYNSSSAFLPTDSEKDIKYATETQKASQ